MDNNNMSVVAFDPAKRMAEKAQREGWEEDTDTQVLDMSDISTICDGFALIRQGMEKISIATGVDLESV